MTFKFSTSLSGDSLLKISVVDIFKCFLQPTCIVSSRHVLITDFGRKMLTPNNDFIKLCVTIHCKQPILSVNLWIVAESISFYNKGSLLNLWRRMHLRDWAPEKHQLLLSKSKRQRYEVNYHPGVFTKPIVVDRTDVYEEGYEMGKRNTDSYI